MDNHKCKRPNKAKESTYGQAIEHVFEENGEFYAGNGEYYTQVNYCPFCSKKATIQIKSN